MPQKPEADRPPDGGRRLTLSWCGRTSKGLVRSNNEDTLWAHPVGASNGKSGNSEGRTESAFPGVLLAVADGMGGALAGEVASGLAVSVVASEMAARCAQARESGAALEEWCTQTLIAAVEAANNAIRLEGESNPQRRGMGTTLTAVWVVGELAVIAQVGDSRAYLFRGGHLKQLTKDQSLVGKLIEDGIITEDEAERIAGKNIILQALGSDEPLEVVAERHRLHPGDALLLCTDGLSGVVSNKDLEDDLRRGGGPEEISPRLVALAEKRGGPDNITVLYLRAAAVGR
jgi:protein phosphatase